MRTHGGKVAGHPNVDRVLFTARRIEQVNGTELFVNDSIWARGSRLDIHAVAGQRLAYLFGSDIVGIEIHRPIAIGKKIDAVADPHWSGVVGILAWEFFDAGIGQIGHPHRRSGAATVMLQAALKLPRLPEICKRDVRQVGIIRGEGAVNRHRKRKDFGQPAVEPHGVQLREARVAVAWGAKDNALAVARPTHHLVRRGM